MRKNYTAEIGHKGDMWFVHVNDGRGTTKIEKIFYNKLNAENWIAEVNDRKSYQVASK